MTCFRIFKAVMLPEEGESIPPAGLIIDVSRNPENRPISYRIAGVH